MENSRRLSGSEETTVINPRLLFPLLFAVLPGFWGNGKAMYSELFPVPALCIQDRGGRKGVGWDVGKGTWRGVAGATVHPVNPLLPQQTLQHRSSQAAAQFYLHSLQSLTQG